MKVLFKKLKKSNKVFLFIYLLALIAYSVSYGFLVKNVIDLDGIETIIRIFVLIFFGLWLLIYLLWNLFNLILKRHITIAITTALTIIFMALFAFANYYFNVVYTSIDNLTEAKYVTYTSNLIALNTTTITENSKLGMINSSLDIESNVLAKELIKDKNLKGEVVSYSSYYEMINDLLNGTVDGIFLKANYMTVYGNEEGFEKLKDTSIVYSFSKKMKNQDTEIVGTKSLKEPFTILLMGVDSDTNGLDAASSFNGDTLMMITFNPKTLNATMFSIPRDTYVPIACNNNRYAKINSSSGYGTNCVISTIKQLTTIDIDYYVKINFKGVVDLVNALDGIDVDVEPSDIGSYKRQYNGQICEQNSLRQFGDNLVCMDTGMQHLNGEQALAYSRCRYGYLMSDIARNKHQQQVIEALAKKLASKSNITKIEDLLNALTNNLATNMSQKQILSLYDVLKNMLSKSFNDGELLSIQKTYLEYYNLPVRLGNNGIFTSAIGYYPGSLDAIVNLMKVNLELEEKEMIKTFSFDANLEYKSKVTGEGITTGEKLETLPNFVNTEVRNVEEWCNAHNITLEKEFVTSDSPFYNPDVTPGMIANQSMSNGVLVKTVSNLTIYLNDYSESQHDDDKKDDDKDNEKDNTKDDDNKGNNDKPDLPDVIIPSDDKDKETDQDE